MLLTVTNLSSTVAVAVPYPFNVSIAASGSATRGVEIEDFSADEHKGSPAWRVWDDLIKRGLISVAGPVLDTVGLGILEILRSTSVTGDFTVGGDIAAVDGTFSGDLVGATSVTATAGGVTATAGDITAAADDIVATLGDITATAGSLNAGTTVTSGTGVAATTGNITADAGDLVATLGGVSAPAGDLAALGGFRTMVGPFVAPGAAGVTAASQADLDCRYSHVAAAVVDFVATRAGSVMGISAALDTAVTGGGFDITAEVTINGVEIVGGPVASLTQAGAEVAASAVIAKDVAAAVFAAGDTIGVSYSSTAITNTPKLLVTVEIEQ